MKKFLALSLLLVAAVGFSASQVLARGGGHGGGGHHGGGHAGGNHGGEHHAENHNNFNHGEHHGNFNHGDHHYHHANWAHHNRPFSRGWYGRHGAGWGYGWGGWGWGNPWGVAGFGAAAAWLGLEGAEPILGSYGNVPTVYTADTEENDEAENEGDDDNSNDGDNADEAAPAGEEATDIDENTAPEDTAAQAAAAAALAKSGQTDPAKDASFLPLGVFTLAPARQAEATALVQLAISKDGVVRGRYYDLLSDQDHPVRGALDKKTQQVAFTFGPQGKVTFETSLANLTQDKGSVAVHYENGRKGTWTLARYEKEPTEAADEAQDAQEKPEFPAEVDPAQAPRTEPAAN
jgi:hypothetical protein